MLAPRWSSLATGAAVCQPERDERYRVLVTPEILPCRFRTAFLSPESWTTPTCTERIAGYARPATAPDAARHQWLFLNTLDSVAALRRHVSFYVVAYNTGEHVPAELASAKSASLGARLHANRSLSCANCERPSAGADGDLSAAT
jgi:hypothetical protein